MRCLDRLRFNGYVVVLPETAGVRETARYTPGCEDDLQRFVVAFHSLFEREPEAVEFGPLEAAPDTEIEAAARQQVNRRGFFGETDRVVEGQDEHRRAEANTVRPGREVAEKRERGGEDAVPREVMLHEKGGIEPERLGSQGLIDAVGELRDLVRRLRPMDVLKQP